MTNPSRQPAHVDPTLRVASRVVLQVAGEVDLCSAARLAAELDSALAAADPGGEVVVDFARATFCDARGLAVLADTHYQAACSHKQVVLANPSRMLRRSLSITGLAEDLCVLGEAELTHG